MVTRIPYVKNYYIKSWSEKISKHIRGIIIKYLKDKRSRISQMVAKVIILIVFIIISRLIFFTKVNS